MNAIAKRITIWVAVIISYCAVLSCDAENSPFPIFGDDVNQQDFEITVNLLDPDGQETRTISVGSPGKLRMTVHESSGRPAQNELIVAQTTKGSFAGSSDGSAMTNSSGIAEMTLQADTDSGAGEVSVKIGDYTWEDTFTFQIGAPADVKLGSFVNGVFFEGQLLTSLDSDELLAIGASATITAALAYLNGPVYEPFDSNTPIQFTTKCSGSSVSDPVYEGNGTTTATYTAGSCNESSDTITASANVTGSSLVASTQIDIATPEIGSIEFISANPEQIALKGTANPQRPSTSEVTFKVKDEIGNPTPGVETAFALSTSKGGLSLSSPTSITDSDGLVTVIVNSGTVPTSVRVEATIFVDGKKIQAQSSSLVVSTGLPDQNSFSISAEILNPEAWDYNEVPVKITASAADHFNNPVPDGTAIYFTTEGGRIEPSCSTLKGSCWVTWTSQDPRPNGLEGIYPDETRGGRVTIIATAIGEESFIDNNGNGRFESSEDTLLSWDDLPEAFLDTNENGVRDGWEEFFDFDEDGDYTQPDLMYNGTLCSDPDNDPNCNNELVDVRASTVIVMSSSRPRPIPPPPVPPVSPPDPGGFYLQPIVENSLPYDDVQFDSKNDVQKVYVYLEDINGNAMPAGSTLTIFPPDNADLSGPDTITLPDQTDPWDYTITLVSDPDASSGAVGVLGATITTPKGLTTSTISIKVISK